MNLIEKVEIFATQELQKKPTASYPYHNLGHTQSVVKHVMEISKKEGISDKDKETLIISAWFHDIGYIKVYQEHEKAGILITKEFLGAANQSLFEKIAGCIISTRLPQNPQNLLEKILCDADMYHLSENNLIESSDQLRREINQVMDRNISLYDYLLITLELLKNHHYFTSFAQNNLESLKMRNIAKIENYLSTIK